MFFDTHAHYDASWFDSDRDALLSALPQFGIGLIVNPGCDLPSSQMAVELGGETLARYAEKAGLTESFTVSGISAAACRAMALQYSTPRMSFGCARTAALSPSSLRAAASRAAAKETPSCKP